MIRSLSISWMASSRGSLYFVRRLHLLQINVRSRAPPTPLDDDCRVPLHWKQAASLPPTMMGEEATNVKWSWLLLENTGLTVSM